MSFNADKYCRAVSAHAVSASYPPALLSTVSDPQHIRTSFVSLAYFYRGSPS